MTKELIQTKPHFERFLKELDKQPLFSLDTETNGTFDIFQVAMVGTSFGWEGYACYIPVAHLKGRQLPIDYVLDSLEKVLLDPDRSIIYHNSVFDEIVYGRHGIDIQGHPHCTAVMAHMYDENYPTKKLKVIVEEYLGVKMQTYDDVIETAPRKRGVKRDYNFARVLLEDAVEYAADDAWETFELFKFFERNLKEQGVWDAYRYIEAPLQRVVRKMKERGVTIDLEAIAEADRHFPKLMEDLESEIYKQAGEVFNLDSPKQLGPILFEKMGIGKNVPKTGKGSYATDHKTLERYSAQSEIVEHILRRKKIKKAHGTFVKGLEKFIGKDGKVHADFYSTGTDTGRFSSSHPNLQNQAGDEIEGMKIRDFFVASSGYRLLVADYSQIELRLLAHFSGDENMIKAFTDAIRDFHDETARKMLQIQGKGITDKEAVTARQRFYAKSLNFGIPYGRGDSSVAEMLGVHRKCGHWRTWSPSLRVWQYVDPDTQEVLDKPSEMCHNCGQCFIRDWYSAFPKVEPFKERVLESARRNGFVRTLSGRKRRLLDINSKDFGRRTHAERQAFNTKIQGSAGDILKLAMISLYAPLEELDAHILMTVHDELVIEAPTDVTEDAKIIIKDVMEHPFDGNNPITLPLVVNPSVCDRWSEGK